jgi:peptidoglycan/xylan/chitin deacetylase (PgdA/CDA1 family)
VPVGKHPVMLTFDDGPDTQFNFIPLDNGQLALDSESAIGILEQFFRDHPDFGRGGHFAILPDRTFAWPHSPEQFQYASQKLEWLLANGYEIGNHTLDHANLAELSPDEVMYQLAEANILIYQQAPEAVVRVQTLPYGGYPNGGDDTVFKGFDYNGAHYSFDGVFLVGANPAVSVLSTEYDPYAIPRIQMFDAEWNQNWVPFLEENPDVLYTSDGNPNTVTVPETLHWALVDTLDETKLGNRQLVRY